MEVLSWIGAAVVVLFVGYVVHVLVCTVRVVRARKRMRAMLAKAVRDSNASVNEARRVIALSAAITSAKRTAARKRKTSHHWPKR